MACIYSGFIGIITNLCFIYKEEDFIYKDIE